MYRRQLSSELASRLSDAHGFIQVVLGPRQVGKTTAVRQALEALGAPAHYATADSPTPLPAVWIQQQWSMARALASDGTPVILALDEIQKIDGWADAVKLERERDAALRLDVRVVVLGSSALLVHKGMSESLAGRGRFARGRLHRRDRRDTTGDRDEERRDGLRIRSSWAAGVRRPVPVHESRCRGYGRGRSWRVPRP